MKNINVQFNDEQINNLKWTIGKKFKKYKSDPFKFTNTVYGVVGLYIGSKVFVLKNEIEEQDYYGVKEDVAILNFRETKNNEIESKISNVKQISVDIESNIKDIVLINETQTLYENGLKTYEVKLTRGIIIKTEAREYAFVKDVWFSEQIEIIRGDNLEEKLLSNYDREDTEFSKNGILKIERNKISLK